MRAPTDPGREPTHMGRKPLHTLGEEARTPHAGREPTHMERGSGQHTQGLNLGTWLRDRVANQVTPSSPYEWGISSALKQRKQYY